MKSDNDLISAFLAPQWYRYCSAHCHFDRSEGAWRNLTSQWYKPYWCRRSLDSEPQQRMGTFVI